MSLLRRWDRSSLRLSSLGELWHSNDHCFLLAVGLSFACYLFRQ